MERDVQLKLARIYYAAAVTVGLLQVIDGILIMLNKGVVNSFNLIVAVIELYWLPVCVMLVFIFRKINMKTISPLSYAVYYMVGITAATYFVPAGENSTPAAVTFWFALVGTIFGTYYVVLNERIKRNP